jgi:hypothetical protein
MKPHALKPASVAYTPRRTRPELFGSCQVGEGAPPYAAA